MNKRKHLLFFLIIMFSFLISSCVYYNTFFNAKKYYSKAVRDKANSQGRTNKNINSTLDKSIKKCAYILKEYPENKWADDALLLLGKCYYEKEQYILALKKFEEFEEYYKNSPNYQEAKLYLAKTHLKLYEFEKANNQFSAIFTRDEFLSIRDEAYLDFAQYYLEKENSEKAKAMLFKLLGLDIKNETQIRAHFLLGEILFEEKKYKAARKQFQQLLKLEPERSKALDSKIYIGRTFIQTNNFSKAQKHFSTLTEDETRPENLHKIAIHLAISKANLGDSTFFEKSFSRLDKKNTSQSVQALANFHRANLYLTLYNNFPQAKNYFEKVKLKSLPDFLKEEYQIKLKLTNKLHEIPDLKNSGKHENLIDTYSQIAEIYCFDLVQPALASDIYDDIESYFSDILIIRDSLTRNIDSLQIRIDEFSITQDTAPADSTLNITLSDSTLSDTLLTDSTATISDTLLTTKLDTSLIDSIETLPDSLQILHLNNNLDSLKAKSTKLSNALAEYKNIHRPKILFMRIWVSQNYFHGDSTKFTYLEELKSDYPNSKYTKSAIHLIQDKPYEKFLKSSEEAKLLFLEAQKQYYDEANISHTFTYLDSIINQFPESPYYPKAIFFKSHLLLTEYADTTGAKPLLQELITDFPEEEFAKKIPSYFQDNKYIFPEILEEDDPEIPDSIRTAKMDTVIIDSTKSDSSKQLGRLGLIDSTVTKSDSLHERVDQPDSLLNKNQRLPKKP